MTGPACTSRRPPRASPRARPDGPRARPQLVAIGVAGGLLSGLLGVGGGVVMVPLLVLWAGYGSATRTPLSLGAIIPISVAGHPHVRGRRARCTGSTPLALAAGAVAGARIGAGAARADRGAAPQARLRLLPRRGRRPDAGARRERRCALRGARGLRGRYRGGGRPARRRRRDLMVPFLTLAARALAACRRGDVARRRPPHRDRGEPRAPPARRRRPRRSRFASASSAPSAACVGALLALALPALVAAARVRVLPAPCRASVWSATVSSPNDRRPSTATGRRARVDDPGARPERRDPDRHSRLRQRASRPSSGSVGRRCARRCASCRRAASSWSSRTGVRSSAGRRAREVREAYEVRAELEGLAAELATAQDHRRGARPASRGAATVPALDRGRDREAAVRRGR